MECLLAGRDGGFLCTGGLSLRGGSALSPFKGPLRAVGFVGQVVFWSQSGCLLDVLVTDRVW